MCHCHQAEMIRVLFKRAWRYLNGSISGICKTNHIAHQSGKCSKNQIQTNEPNGSISDLKFLIQHLIFTFPETATLISGSNDNASSINIHPSVRHSFHKEPLVQAYNPEYRSKYEIMVAVRCNECQFDYYLAVGGDVGFMTLNATSKQFHLLKPPTFLSNSKLLYSILNVYSLTRDAFRKKSIKSRKAVVRSIFWKSREKKA